MTTEDMINYTSPPDAIDHIQRATLPWRAAAQLTECGRKLSDVKGFITRDEAEARHKRLGHKRAMFSMCMTCLDAVSRWKTWQEDPVDAIRRESADLWNKDQPRADQLRKELRAIAALIEAHRDEFDGYLTGLEHTISLADARQARRRRR